MIRTPLLEIVFVIVLLAAPAAAVNITLSGPTSGPVASGVGSEDAAGASQVTFTVAFDTETAITGYDVSVAWDPTEVALVAAQQLFPDTGAPGPFFVSPVGGDSAGSRVAAIAGFSPVPTMLLFGLTFDRLGASNADGAADVRVFLDAPTNGPGLSPGGVTLGNPLGAGIDLVAVHAPEPSTVVLVAAGLAGLLGAARCSSC